MKKRIVSLVLAALMLLTVVFSFAGCGSFNYEKKAGEYVTLDAMYRNLISQEKLGLAAGELSAYAVKLVTEESVQEEIFKKYEALDLYDAYLEANADKKIEMLGDGKVLTQQPVAASDVEGRDFRYVYLYYTAVDTATGRQLFTNVSDTAPYMLRMGSGGLGGATFESALIAAGITPDPSYFKVSDSGTIASDGKVFVYYDYTYDKKGASGEVSGSAGTSEKKTESGVEVVTPVTGERLVLTAGVASGALTNANALINAILTGGKDGAPMTIGEKYFTENSLTGDTAVVTRLVTENFETTLDKLNTENKTVECVGGTLPYLSFTYKDATQDPDSDTYAPDPDIGPDEIKVNVTIEYEVNLKTVKNVTVVAVQEADTTTPVTVTYADDDENATLKGKTVRWDVAVLATGKIGSAVITGEDYFGFKYEGELEEDAEGYEADVIAKYFESVNKSQNDTRDTTVKCNVIAALWSDVLNGALIENYPQDAIDEYMDEKIDTLKHCYYNLGKTYYYYNQSAGATIDYEKYPDFDSYAASVVGADGSTWKVALENEAKSAVRARLCLYALAQSLGIDLSEDSEEYKTAYNNIENYMSYAIYFSASDYSYYYMNEVSSGHVITPEDYYGDNIREAIFFDMTMSALYDKVDLSKIEWKKS